jgi:hypothetical protein
VDNAIKLILVAAVAAFGANRANAVPAFAVQTRQPCSSCHIGGFGPQLTPFGRQFKLEGYTLRAGQIIHRARFGDGNRILLAHQRQSAVTARIPLWNQ